MPEVFGALAAKLDLRRDCFHRQWSTYRRGTRNAFGFSCHRPNVELAVIEQREFELPADSADIGLRKE
jgi:hypothetical protein